MKPRNSASIAAIVRHHCLSARASLIRVAIRVSRHYLWRIVGKTGVEGGGGGFFVFVTVHRSFRNARAQSVCLSVCLSLSLSLSSILIGGRCIQSSNAYLSLIRLDSIARWFAGNLNTKFTKFYWIDRGYYDRGIFIFSPRIFSRRVFFFFSTKRIFFRFD